MNRMVDAARWGGLRPDPYDPGAKDADLDGIIQEGTAWERPAGTRILDEFGNEIVAGLVSLVRNPQHRIVDADGNPVDYTPRDVEDVGGGTARSALARLGYESLAEQNLPTTLQTNLDAMNAPPADIINEVMGVLEQLPYEPGELAWNGSRGQRLERLYLQERVAARENLMRMFGAGYGDDGPPGWGPYGNPEEPLNFDLADPWWDGKIPAWTGGDGMTRRELANRLLRTTHDPDLETLAETLAQDTRSQMAFEFDRRARDDVIVSFPLDSGKRILESGRFKTQFEVSRSQGELDTEKRAAAELEQLGIPTDLEARLRPIYGHLDTRAEGETIDALPGSGYGDRDAGIHFVLGDAARARSTMTHGDSLAAGGPIAIDMEGERITPEMAMHASSLALRQHARGMMLMDMVNIAMQQDRNSPEAIARADTIFRMVGNEELGFHVPTTMDQLLAKYPSVRKYYFEAQVHGGASVEDIGYIVVPDGESSAVTEIRALAADLNIPVLTHSEARKGEETIARVEAILNGGDALSDAELDARHVSPSTKTAIDEFRATKAMVLGKYGWMESVGDARAALAQAFPNLRHSVDDIPFYSLKYAVEDPDVAAHGLSARERGWVYGLLRLAEEHPEIARHVVQLNHVWGQSDAAATAGVRSYLDAETGLPHFGYGLQWMLDVNPGGTTSLSDNYEREIADSARTVMQILQTRGLDEAERKRLMTEVRDKLFFKARSLAAVDMLLDPRVSDTEVTEYLGMGVAEHEWGHLLDFNARLADAGVHLDDTQDRVWLLQAHGAASHGRIIEGMEDPLLSQQQINDMHVNSVNQVNRSIERLIENTPPEVRVRHDISEIMAGYHEIDTAYDNLSPEAKVAFQSLAHRVISEYARTNSQETTAEFFQAMRSQMEEILDRAETPDARAAVLQVFDWLRGERDARHARPIRRFPLQPPTAASTPERVNLAIQRTLTPESTLRYELGAFADMRAAVNADHLESAVQEVHAIEGWLMDDSLTPERRADLQALLATQRERVQTIRNQRLDALELRLQEAAQQRATLDRRLFEEPADDMSSWEMLTLTQRRAQIERVILLTSQTRDAMREDPVEDFASHDKLYAHVQALTQHLIQQELAETGIERIRELWRAGEEAQEDRFANRPSLPTESMPVEDAWRVLSREYQFALVEMHQLLKNHRRYQQLAVLRDDFGPLHDSRVRLEIDREALFIEQISFDARVRFVREQLLEMEVLADSFGFGRDLRSTTVPGAGIEPAGQRILTGRPVAELQQAVNDEPTILDDALVRRLQGTAPSGEPDRPYEGWADDADRKAATLAGSSAVTSPDDSVSILSLCTGYPTGTTMRSPKAVETKAMPHLRVVPYDPDCRDGDGDHLCQEGTIWERPAGTRWVTQTGRDLARGFVGPHSEARLVDQQGRTVEHTPGSRPSSLGPTIGNMDRTVASAVTPRAAKKGVKKRAAGTVERVVERTPSAPQMRTAPRREAEIPTYPKRVPVSDVLYFHADPFVERKLGPIVEAIDKIHGIDPQPLLKRDVPANDPLSGAGTRTSVLWKRQRGRFVGLFFSEGNNPSAARPEPLIEFGPDRMYPEGGKKLVDVPHSAELTFLHELGHRIDYQYRYTHETVGSRGTNRKRDGHGFQSKLARIFPEMAAFLAAAVDNPHFAEQHALWLEGLAKGADPQYFASVHEVWARAYEQWIVHRLFKADEDQFGDLADAFDARAQENGWLWQWPWDLFLSDIAPKLEAVMRARGLM